MTLLILACLAGVLTIATPCIVPILPSVFAAVASLTSAAGGWAVEANRQGRTAALALMSLFGLTILPPTLAATTTAIGTFRLTIEPRSVIDA